MLPHGAAAGISGPIGFPQPGKVLIGKRKEKGRVLPQDCYGLLRRKAGQAAGNPRYVLSQLDILIKVRNIANLQNFPALLPQGERRIQCGRPAVRLQAKNILVGKGAGCRKKIKVILGIQDKKGIRIGTDHQFVVHHFNDLLLGAHVHNGRTGAKLCTVIQGHQQVVKMLIKGVQTVLYVSGPELQRMGVGLFHSLTYLVSDVQRRPE